MIVRCVRSICSRTGGHGPARALLIIRKQRHKFRCKIQTFSSRLPTRVGVVWDLEGGGGLPQANAPPQKLHSGRGTRRRRALHSFHLEGIVRARWESGRWVAARVDLLSDQFC